MIIIAVTVYSEGSKIEPQRCSISRLTHLIKRSYRPTPTRFIIYSDFVTLYVHNIALTGLFVGVAGQTVSLVSLSAVYALLRNGIWSWKKRVWSRYDSPHGCQCRFKTEETLNGGGGICNWNNSIQVQ